MRIRLSQPPAGLGLGLGLSLAIINPTASKPKDQELSCNKCGLFFHKRCTDRRQTTANWKKNPWYCQPCLLRDPTQGQSCTLNPTAHVFTPPQYISQAQTYNNEQQVRPQNTHVPLQHSVADHQLNLHSIDSVRVQQESQVTTNTTHSTSTPRASSAPTTVYSPVVYQPPTTVYPSLPLSQSDHTAVVDRAPVTAHPRVPPPQQANHIQPRFPNNGGRQRTTNVPLENPELEFQRTALDSCRSTIVQQEADLKRLNETLDIRNKRIMQLEDQIGIAASYVSNRDTDIRGASVTSSDLRCENLSQISDKLNNLVTKISMVVDQFISRSHAVNIYNTTSSTHRQVVYDRGTQTMDGSSVQNNDSMNEQDTLDSEEIILQCTVCSNTFKSSSDLDNHIESTHRGPNDNYSACPTADTSSQCLNDASSIPQSSSQKL